MDGAHRLISPSGTDGRARGRKFERPIEESRHLCPVHLSTTFFPRLTLAPPPSRQHLFSWADVAFLFFRIFSFHFQLSLRHFR